MSVCPKCGKPGSKGLCNACKPNPILDRLTNLKLVYCHKSLSVRLGSRWVYAPTIEEAVVKYFEFKAELKDNVQYSVYLEDDSFTIGPGVERKTKLIITGTIDGQEHTMQVPIQISITVSPKHAKGGTRYFEGCFQLRNYHANHHKHILDYLRNEIKKLENKGGYVTKEKKLKTGFDFWMTKQTLMPALAQKIVKEFGGEVKRSAKLYSQDHQTSKQVYRGSMCVILPDFVKGEILEIEHQLYKVVSSKGKKFSCIKLADFSKATFETSRHKYILIAQKQHIKKTRVSKLTPQLEVLHPETYQSTPVQNRTFPKNYTINEYIHVVEHNKKLWVVK